MRNSAEHVHVVLLLVKKRLSKNLPLKLLGHPPMEAAPIDKRLETIMRVKTGKQHMRMYYLHAYTLHTELNQCLKG